MDRFMTSSGGLTAGFAAQLRAPASCALACVLMALVLARGESPAIAPLSDSQQASTVGDAESLPSGAQSAVSAALGAADPAYGLVAGAGGFTARNPAQRLALAFTSSGALFSSGRTHVRLTLRGVGYGEALRPISARAPAASGNRVAFAREGLSEWYVNGPLGVEQGFTVARSPARRPEGPLTLSMSISPGVRARIAADGRSISFTRPDGPSLQYGDLSASDARGRLLPSRLELRGARILLRVDARGARFPLRIDPLVQQGSKITAPTVGGQDRFGFSVALSGDGNTALIGAREESTLKGGAWVFTRSGDSWTQQGPELTSSDPEEFGSCEGEGELLGCGFGASVALSRDGSTAIVGAPGADDHQGAAFVFARTGGAWAQQGPALRAVDEIGRGNLGRSVALSADGSTAAIGAPTDHEQLGAVWVFTRAAGAWSEQAKLLGGEGAGAPQFGRDVAVAGDGSTILVGGPSDAHGTGAAWVFSGGGSAWEQQGPKLIGAQESGQAYFGLSLVLSADAGTVLVGGGSDGAGVGAAWVFTQTGGAWRQQGPKLTGELESGAAKFGHSVALDAHGERALIGGLGDNQHAGAAWTFTRSGSSWSQQGAKLLGADASGRAWFGASVALSDDGRTALVGGFRDSAEDGAAWIFAEPAAPAGEPPGSEPEPESSGPAGTNTPVTGRSGVLGSTSVLLAPPVFGVSGNLTPISGLVLVKLPGAAGFVPLTEVRQVPFGTIIDATRGKVAVTTARAHGGTQTVTFYSGRFRITQARNGLVIAALAGGNFGVCPTASQRRHLARAAARRASGRHVVRKLWAEGHGSYSTKGNYATGAVLGTRWLTEDLCEGTLIRVATDKVAVRNLVTHRRRRVIGSGGGGLQADVAIGTGVGVDVGGVLAPLLGGVEALAAVRARVAWSVDRSAVGDGLIVDEHVAERLESNGAVHDVRGRGVHVVDVAQVAGTVVAGVNAASGWHVGASRATDGTAGRRATIDILAVAELVVVPGGVVALGGVEIAQGALSAGVHRQEVLPILLLIVGFQLGLGGERRARRNECPRHAVEAQRIVGERDRRRVQPRRAVVAR